ncbi:MAG: hypothetical protein AUK37_02895 [Rhodobacterales bacterium CG2_30_65_12]|nr:MAG: hypothetical protein AUK37_02895 [Rhodobacterales bacterium CG2_30_65_12]
MSQRPTTAVFASFAALGLAFGAAGLHAALSGPAQAARMTASARLVGQVGLTDLALFTEARYARHPSMADLHTAFQDNPMSFEHFPAGSFVPLPESLGQGRLGFSEAEVAR